MKPKIKKISGWWVCYRGEFSLLNGVGVGYSPAIAYENWRRQVRV